MSLQQWAVMLPQDNLSLEYGDDMLLIATSLVGGFIFAALLTEDVDDDDNGPDSGLMQPVYQGTN